MSVSYSAPVQMGKGQSNVLNNIKALSESFEAQNIQIFSESGYSEVLSNEVSFNEYTAGLVEGCDEQTTADLTTLASNTRLVTLSESMVSGANPITALSLPMLRIGFPKMAVREGLPTEPVQQPKFKVTTKRPFVMDTKTNTKVYLPEGLQRRELYGLPKLKGDLIDLTEGKVENYDLLAPINKNAALGDEIDPKFSVVAVKVTKDSAAKEYNVSFKLDTNINVINGTVKLDSGESVTILGTVDRSKGLLNIATLAPAGVTVNGVKVQGYVSSEANNSAVQVGFDITAQEYTIGTGQPIESPINIQAMTDVMAMYQIDSTLVHMETMSTVLAQNTDLEGVEFIDRVIDTSALNITESFDVVPPSNFNQGDAAWREQIKLKFDRLVSKLQTKFNIYAGHTVIFCHPLDAQVISNVKWVFSTDEQPNDVAVSYKVGTYTSGTTTYYVLQSPYFSQGKFRLVYIPSEADFKSLVYYPYSFNTIRGAISPNQNSGNMPSIQMIKRYLFQEFTPMCANLTIKNND